MTLSLVSLVFIAVIGLLAIGLYALLVVRHLIKVCLLYTSPSPRDS